MGEYAALCDGLVTCEVPPNNKKVCATGRMKLGHLLMMKMRMKVINFRELNSIYLLSKK